MTSPLVMTIREEQPEGSVVVVTGHMDAVNVGGLAILRSFDFTASEFDAPGVELRMHIEVESGVPHCTEVAFRVMDGGPSDVPAGVVRDFKLEDMIEFACGRSVMNGGPEVWAQMRAGDSTMPVVAWEPTFLAAHAATRKARDRSPYSDDRLREVAAIYTDNIESFPTRAVRKAFGVAQSTAQLYVKKARDEGLITVPAPRGGRP